MCNKHTEGFICDTLDSLIAMMDETEAISKIIETARIGQELLEDANHVSEEELRQIDQAIEIVNTME